MMRNAREGEGLGKHGVFLISLDFELYWGMHDKLTLDAYRANLLGVRVAVPAMLDCFARYDIHATWATVGFLFFDSRDALMAGVPSEQPEYTNHALSPYRNLTTIGANEETDPFHYAPSLIRLIQSYPHQEIATHTFSHYYCLEDGQTRETFRADVRAAQRVAADWGITLHSLVFPRNQFNAAYIAVCEELGITSYRGNPTSWMYRARSDEENNLRVRGLRLADSYANLSSHNGHDLSEIAATYPFNIPASRFLRPYSQRLAPLDPLRLRRIRDDLTHAAKTGTVYHLWWHPHNFGVHTEENIAFLARILDHYRTLRERYGMESLTMEELADRLLRETGRA